MNKYVAVLTVLLTILCHSEYTHGQVNTTRGDAIFAANESSTSNKPENKTRSQEVSPEASAEAKRLYKLGVKYGRGGLIKQAAELFQQALRLNPNYADAHYSLGNTYFDQGRWDEAIPFYENALKINPKDKAAREMLKAAREMLEEGKVLQAANKKPSPPPQEESKAADNVSPDIASDSRQGNTATGTPVSLRSSTDSRPTNSRSASTAGNDLTRVYHIGIGDVLDVRLGDEPATQSTLFTVTPAGLLEHPSLPEPIQVSGITVEEAKARLEADLKRRAVSENPRVLVGVREYLSHAIIVSGLVKEPGTKLLRREAIPLYVVIADAQPGPEAGRATLIRYETDEILVIDLSKPAEMNLLVRAGDVIMVQANPKQFFYVGGEVKSPGEKQFRSGLTLTQAILAAGGLSSESKTVLIAREGNNGLLASTTYKLKDINRGKLADPLIQPGDRITVEQ